MTELSNLRLRLTAAERDRKESDDKSRKLEVNIFYCIMIKPHKFFIFIIAIGLRQVENPG